MSLIYNMSTQRVVELLYFEGLTSQQTIILLHMTWQDMTFIFKCHTTVLCF